MLSPEEINKLFPEFKKKQEKAKGKKGKFSFGKDDYEYIISSPAYNDMQPRLLPGIGGKGKDEDWKKQIKKNKSNLWKELSKMFEDYFNNPEPPRTEEEFDEKHDEICSYVEDYFKRDPKSHPEGGLDFKNYKYGQAQKLINMAFKYFYCFDEAKSKEDYFKFCHMPIDRYILAWYYRVILSKKKSFDRLPPWSKMDEQTINEIQDNIFKYMSKNPVVKNGKKLTPLEAEFYIWNEEKKHI